MKFDVQVVYKFSAKRAVDWVEIEANTALDACGIAKQQSRHPVQSVYASRYASQGIDAELHGDS